MEEYKIWFYTIIKLLSLLYITPFYILPEVKIKMKIPLKKQNCKYIHVTMHKNQPVIDWLREFTSWFYLI